MNLSEHEVRRHIKKFVELYINENPTAAGKYAMENMVNPEEATDEELAFWRTNIEEEFNRQGYDLEEDNEEVA